MIKRAVLLLFCTTQLFAGQGALMCDLCSEPSYTLTIPMNENGGTAPVAIKCKDGVLSYKALAFSGTPIWTPGPNGSGLYFPGNTFITFDGSDAFFEFPTDGSTPIRVTFWFYQNISGYIESYLIMANQWRFNVAPDGQIFAYGRELNPPITTPTGIIPFGRWIWAVHKWNAVSKEHSIQLFYDGKRQFKQSTSDAGLATFAGTVNLGDNHNYTAGVIAGCDTFTFKKTWISDQKDEQEYLRMIRGAYRGRK